MGSVSTIVGDFLPGLPGSHPHYWTALTAACDRVDPPFGQAGYGALFRREAMDLDWLARLLVLNAQKEADGSRQLWAFAGRIADPDCREQVRSHAVDESRHASFYISLLQLAFPESFSPQEVEALHAISPGFKTTDAVDLAEPSDDDLVLDELIQMNIGEIRTLINQLLMRPVLSLVCPDQNASRLLRLFDSLSNDEVRHIAYTADLIESRGAAARTAELMQLRLDEFSDITRRELGGAQIEAAFE
jgi:hypothetical protein